MLAFTSARQNWRFKGDFFRYSVQLTSTPPVNIFPVTFYTLLESLFHPLKSYIIRLSFLMPNCKTPNLNPNSASIFRFARHGLCGTRFWYRYGKTKNKVWWRFWCVQIGWRYSDELRWERRWEGARESAEESEREREKDSEHWPRTVTTGCTCGSGVSRGYFEWFLCKKVFWSLR